MKPQFLIGGATSGSGKTVFALGLLRALRKRGIKVQPFKCGPGFMDTQLHTISSGVDSVNLDSWFAGRTHLQYVYNKYGEKADICMIEGNSALYDGYRRMQGSSAEMSQLLSVPVILVVNARLAAYSVAPMLYGYRLFRSQVKIIGVVFTQVSSFAHFTYLKDACNDAGLNCLGYIPFDDSVKLPQRHVAITQSVRSEIEELAEKVSEYVEQNVDIDRIIKMCTRIFPCKYTLPYTSDLEETETEPVIPEKRFRIAIAKDSALNFLYKENLDKLSSLGSIMFFSPLYAKELPEADLVYLPGGFPELFARQLYRRKEFLHHLKSYAECGGKILAEGGAVALLAQTLTARDGGTPYEMSGILPIHCFVNKTGVISGYRMVSHDTAKFKGYESRYLSFENADTDNPDSVISKVIIENTRGVDSGTPLFRYKNVIASFTHFYWGDTDIIRLWD